MMTDQTSDFEDAFSGQVSANQMPHSQYGQPMNQYDNTPQPNGYGGGQNHGHAPERWGGSEEGSIATIPAISVKAFCERQATAQLVASAAADRRMGRANVDIQSGGVIAATEYLKSNPCPNLLILECSGSAPDVVARIDELAEYCEETVQVLVIGLTNDVQLYRELMKRGVSEYLVPPLETLQLVSSISGLFSGPDAFCGRTVGVIGAKGGVGSSSIAHNLAWLMSAMDGLNCSIMDLDLHFGTSSMHFNVQAQQTTLKALQKEGGIDKDFVESILTDVNDRLSIYASPADLDRFGKIQDSSYQTFIDAVRKTVPYLVLDMPSSWESWAEGVVLSSDDLIIVAEPELVSLRNTKSFLDRVAEARPNDAPPKVVLNKVGLPGRPEISAGDFGSALGWNIAATIPFHSEIFGRALNDGKMLSEIDHMSQPNQALISLACSLTGLTAPEAPKKKSIFQQFKSQLPL